MVYIRSSQFFSLLISFSLLVAPSPLSAMAQEGINNRSNFTKQNIDEYSDEVYIYFGKELSNIREVISQLSDLDANDNSPLHALDKHLKSDLNVAEYNAVIEVLEYAENFLQKNYTQLNPTQAQKIQSDFDEIMNQIISGVLVVNASNLENFQDTVNKKIASLPSYLQELDQDAAIYSDSATRVVEETLALVVSTANVDVTAGGLLTIDGVTLSVNDRVLLVNQTNPIENGLWLAQSGTWTRPADFASGNPAGQTYVLILSGTVNAGTSWLCTTPLAIIDTDPIAFVLYSLSAVTLGANVGAGTGLIFRDKTGTTLNFKSLIAGTDIVIANNTNDITIATNATNLNTANTLVARDASGNLSAGIISLTDGVISTSLTLVPFNAPGVVHNDVSGLLSSSLLVNADISTSAGITDNKLATITTAGKINNSATTANSANLANAIVARDASGNFFAQTITATLNGNAATATSATTATTATNFTGSLVGDVTGTQGATVVSSVGGETATHVAAATTLANAATAVNTANAIIRRDASGNFSAGAISVTDEAISSSLTITPFSVAGVVHNAASGLLSSSLIVNADISSSAAIADSKLATISTAGKVANSATTATGLNTANTIVARDASGNFSASIVIASLLGAASLNVLKTGDILTGALQLPAGTTAAPSLKFTGSTNTGLSASSGNLIFSTSGLERMRITSSGTVTLKVFTSAGVVHTDALGNLSSSLIVDSNIAAGAGILDTKLATISTAGKINNSATTATYAAHPNTIVSRDTLGNFSANVVTVVDLNASGNLILSTDPSTSTAGNILKGSSSFIHDFGIDNTFVGINAGNFTMSGNGLNSIVGSNAFSSNASGDNNAALGSTSLPMCTTGSNNIAIGSGAGGTLTTGSGNIYINANAATSAESSTTRIGSSQTQCYIAGIYNNPNTITGSTVLVDANGQLGIITSSERYKRNIQTMDDISTNVLNLNPVTFTYRNDEENTQQFGLIAEEVAEVLPAIVLRNTDGQPETVQYHMLPVLLLNEIKKQQITIEGLKANDAQRNTMIQDLLERIKVLEARA